MKLSPFIPALIPHFLGLADQEGWVADQWEFDFLLSSNPNCCWCAIDHDEHPVGFVTAIRHGRSGWIGNLIVADASRGSGIGNALFLRAVEALRGDGVVTVWLTASEMGKGMYERHGFRAVDTVIRWSGGEAVRHPEGTGDSGGWDFESCCAIDSSAWGDRRRELLAAVMQRGAVISEPGGHAVLQPVGGMMQLGPYTAGDASVAGRLLDRALRQVTAGRRLCIDVPASNRAAGRLYSRRRLRMTGVTTLMYAGEKPEYRPKFIFGLATMGSCG